MNKQPNYCRNLFLPLDDFLINYYKNINLFKIISKIFILKEFKIKKIK